MIVCTFLQLSEQVASTAKARRTYQSVLVVSGPADNLQDPCVYPLFAIAVCQKLLDVRGRRKRVKPPLLHSRSVRLHHVTKGGNYRRFQSCSYLYYGHNNLILCFTDCLDQKHDAVGRQKNKNKNDQTSHKFN